ncbi:MAG: hypothetical protein KC421_01755 [Anaerolineales bacterium]|nr:hypothetical protein [Anaerolineales bacterium]
MKQQLQLYKMIRLIGALIVILVMGGIISLFMPDVSWHSMLLLFGPIGF